jgi:hypothetical protein
MYMTQEKYPIAHGAHGAEHVRVSLTHILTLLR